MIGQFVIGGEAVRVDFGRGVCVAIPLDFAGPQPSHFGAPPATAQPMRAGGFVGDTRQGGSCNVPVVTLNPHCNGTHAESAAHIIDDSVPVHEAIPGKLLPATLTTVTPRIVAKDAEANTENVAHGKSDGGPIDEHYRPALQPGDQVITAAALAVGLAGVPDVWLEAVIVRTLPNDPDKRFRRYGIDQTPPFFTIESIDYLVGRGMRHLLVDVPSVDRMHDEGLLTVHHRFWNVPEGGHQLTGDSRTDRSITEMIYAPDTVADGRFLLNLQIPAFTTDVAPCRPWIYPVQ